MGYMECSAETKVWDWSLLKCLQDIVIVNPHYIFFCVRPKEVIRASYFLIQTMPRTPPLYYPSLHHRNPTQRAALPNMADAFPRSRHVMCRHAWCREVDTWIEVQTLHLLLHLPTYIAALSTIEE